MRLAAMIAGVLGAGTFAQAPEYSQQYLQRLSGAVDELQVVVEDFDRSATRAGLSREEALAELSGTAFLDNRNADVTRTVRRYEALSGDLDLLRAANPVERAALAPLRLDGEIAARAWGDFQPGLPATTTGAGFAAAGFVAGYGGWIAIMGGFLFVWRRLRRAGRPVGAASELPLKDDPRWPLARAQARAQARATGQKGPPPGP